MITQTIAIIVSLCLIPPAQPAVDTSAPKVTITGGGVADAESKAEEGE